MNLDVSRKPIPDILTLLKKGEWQVPKFQREFVWKLLQVRELLKSVFRARPIGMVTVWTQPQGRQLTPPEPLTLKAAEYKYFSENPPVMKLILDGKQRLTALAMAFGGLRNPGDNYSFSHRWFLNFNENQESESFILFKKRSECATEGLEVPTTAFSRGLLPLDNYERFGELMTGLHNSNNYPNGELPDQNILELRRSNLTSFCNTFQKYQIPVAELPETIKLDEVCEIFEVLNTQGTKVSTFDLIHNTIFGDTGSDLNLRETFENISEESLSFSNFCVESRREFLCQTVTACFLTKDGALGRNQTPITSIKSKDLLETPTDFYRTFFQRISVVDGYSRDVFNFILGSDFQLNEIPYPVSMAIYFALRWRLDHEDQQQIYQTAEINKVFKAFFWRNAFTNRYDQGYLGSFPSDLKFLQSLLLRLVPYRNSSQYVNEANEGIKSHFGSTHSALPANKIKELLLSPETAGALEQAIRLFLYSKTTGDILSGKTLDRFSTNRFEKVDIHHIYPKKWCIDNAAMSESIRDSDGAIANCLANFIPLSSASNNKWRTKAPSTALREFGITFENHNSLLSKGFIDNTLFNILKSPSKDPMEFWEKRAALISSELFKLQFVS